MHLIVNGRPHDAPDGTTLPALISAMGLTDKPCAVEVNTTLVPKAEHAACMLQDGDTIELVTLVGGG